jgi:hypothetical protein
LRDEQGQILDWEANINLILTNDPDIFYALLDGTRELERATIDALLFLQQRYRIRATYSILIIMMKLLAESIGKRAIRDALSR